MRNMFAWLDARLSRQWTLWLVVALAIVGALEFWLARDLTHRHLFEQVRQRSSRLSAGLAPVLANASTTEEAVRLVNALRTITLLPNVPEVAIIDADGIVIVDGNAAEIGRPFNTTRYPGIETMIAACRAHGDVRHGPIGNGDMRWGEVRRIPCPFIEPQRGPALSVVVTDYSSLRAAEVRAGGLILAGAIAHVLLLCGMMWVLLRQSVLKPLRRLSDAARTSAETGSYESPQGVGRSEIGRLADVFEDVFGKLSESRLQSQKLALVVARTDNSVVITDALGRVEWVNDGFTRITGYTLDEVRGRTPGSFLQGPETDATTVQYMHDRLVRGEGFRVEIINYGKSGRKYWIEVEVQPIRDATGRITNFMGIQSEITLRKRAEMELRAQHELNVATLTKLEVTLRELDRARLAAEDATRAKSEFLANMSHEIRTPMTAILGFAEVALESELNNGHRAERIDSLRTILRNGEYLLEIINDILDLSKIEAGRLDIVRTHCQMRVLVQELEKLMRVRAAARGLSLDLEFEGRIPERIETDPLRLRQILLNLIGNAVKFTEKGGVRLIVSADAPSVAAPKLRFDVVDTGIGMTSAQAAALFQPFSQGDASTTRQYGGTGLGLVISRRLAQLLDGDVNLVETRSGAGSRFRATIGMGNVEGVAWIDNAALSTAAAEEVTARETAARQLDCTVLLAEDGPDNQRLISHMLKRFGAQVEVVENGRLAVEQALAAREGGTPFDVILMDMQMPEMDGYAATRLLRQKGYRGPIIALTAHAMAMDREKCLRAGCDAYASKPVDFARLNNLIGDHLAAAHSA